MIREETKNCLGLDRVCCDLARYARRKGYEFAFDRLDVADCVILTIMERLGRNDLTATAPHPGDKRYSTKAFCRTRRGKEGT